MRDINMAHFCDTSRPQTNKSETKSSQTNRPQINRPQTHGIRTYRPHTLLGFFFNLLLPTAEKDKYSDVRKNITLKYYK